MRNPLSAEALSNLIGSIYDCALEPARWPGTLARLNNSLDFANGGVVLQALPSGDMLLDVWSGLEPVWLEQVPQYAADSVETWGGAEAMRNFPLGEPFVLSQVRDRSEWENNRFSREWAKPQGIHDFLAVGLVRDATTMGSIGFGRHDSQGEIGEFELEAARLLIPHLQRTVVISRLLDIKSVVATIFESALDALAVGVLLVGADLRIVYANQAARATLAAGDVIHSERGVLTLRQPTWAAALAAAVRQAAEDAAAIGRRGFGIPAGHRDGRPFVLHMLPLKSGTLRKGLARSAVAAIFVTPAISPAPVPLDALAALYDLTVAEARVFEQIAAGRTTLETAAALGIRRTTVKTHLEHIFLKTEVSRQADLIKLAHSLAMPLQRSPHSGKESLL
ncbi:helix-turn-helix transcriptional regulator [Mesorhizobium captivum]|uniref:helix-turn-helix transcriptional regulator n=1 Tax=Mesorhizobium captivum TaxID=3072319 RepID=UPI002A23FC4D|nr:LuxR C-terminal-related transcriptional regulator [Mesorhizobium sp. VK3C]MDX8450344.1 LuxR C-terminal-related transcriptional regulator [Mesorhizobium sp. VK3C]